jgi:3-hydroxyisobutyrate dehydrogenase-like beta-hydroxyacid dehydrogenase
MVRRLVAAGYEVQVLARTPEAADALAADGARPVGSVAAVAAPVVLVCVFTDAQVREVGPELVEAMPTGSVLVVHTTCAPATVASLASRGVDVVDAAFTEAVGEFLTKDVAAARETAAQLGVTLGVLDTGPRSPSMTHRHR